MPAPFRQQLRRSQRCQRTQKPENFESSQRLRTLESSSEDHGEDAAPFGAALFGATTSFSGNQRELHA